MKDRVCYILGLIVLGITVFSASTARAYWFGWRSEDCASWDKKIGASNRFVVLSKWNNEAVLDRETCLVWEQSPSTDTFLWDAAEFHCNNLQIGNRMGWRLPTSQELASLIDPTHTGPALPSGHPFSNVQASYYWAATTYSGDTTLAWYADIDAGFVTFQGKNDGGLLAWCVRGGQGVDSQ